MRSLQLSLLLAVFLTSGCIGTDIVEELRVPEMVSITGSIDSLRVGDSFTFSADYFDELGSKADATVSWSSSDDAIVEILPSGQANALSAGDVYIRAMVGEAVDSVALNAGTTTSEIITSRSGTFQGNRDYRVSGTFTLSEVGDDLELTFSSDFRSSNGPGLYVYLSNSNTSVSGGVEVGRLQRNSGEQTYTISGMDAQLNTFSSVIIYCKPFGIAFGFGQFQ